MGVEVLDDAVGGIAELADVQEVGLRIVLGTARDRGPAEDDHAPVTVRARDDVVDEGALRSEEHTSELQSHSDLVCRLLLEKKKTTRPGSLTCLLKSTGASWG